MELSLSLGVQEWQDWVLVPKGNSERPWSCRAYLHHRQCHGSDGAAEIAPWGVRDKEALLRSQISRPRNVRLASPAPGEGKPTERELALQRPCLHSTATVETRTVTGSQVGCVTSLDANVTLPWKSNHAQ